jgi:hypothetical protein
MAQHEVLRPRRRADRIGLHEAEPVDGRREVAGCEERARDRVAAKMGEVERRRHGREARNERHSIDVAGPARGRSQSPRADVGPTRTFFSAGGRIRRFADAAIVATRMT